MNERMVVEEWFDAYCEELKCYFVYSIQSQEVEHLVQDTFQHALHHFSSFQQHQYPKTWLFSIAHNVISQQSSEQSSNPIWKRLLSGRGKQKVPLDEETNMNDLNNDIYLAFCKLPENKREVLFLVLLMEFPFTEVAEVLQSSEKKVKNRYDIAWRALEESLPYSMHEIKEVFSKLSKTVSIPFERKEMMKQELRLEVGKHDRKPLHIKKSSNKKGMVAGVSAALILMTAVYVITDRGQSQTQSNPAENVGEENEEQQEKQSVYEFHGEIKSQPNLEYMQYAPGGELLLFVQGTEDGQYEIALQHRSEEEPTILKQIEYFNHEFRWSPNGRYIVMYRDGGEQTTSLTFIDVEKRGVMEQSFEAKLHNVNWEDEGNGLFFQEYIQSNDKEYEQITHYSLSNREEKVIASGVQDDKPYDYSIQRTSPTGIKINKLLANEGIAKDLFFEKQDDEWMKVDETSYAPYSQSFIERYLYLRDDTNVKHMSWSGNNKKVIYVEENKDTRLRSIKIWEVGEESPRLIIPEQEDIQNVRSFTWSSDNKYVLTSYTLFNWNVFNMDDLSYTSMKEATQEPVWGPDHQIAVIQSLNNQKDANDHNEGVSIYTLDNNNQLEGETIHSYNSNAGTATLYGWDDPSRLNVRFENREFDENAYLSFENKQNGWQRVAKDTINAHAFQSSVWGLDSIQRDDPYSMWEEINKTSPLPLGNGEEATVHIFANGNTTKANAPAFAYIRYDNKWFRVGRVGYKDDSIQIDTEQYTSDENREIVINGSNEVDGGFVQQTYIIGFNPTQEQGSYFKIIASIPNFQEIDVDADGDEEMVSTEGGHQLKPFTTVFYIPHFETFDRINVGDAIGSDYARLEKNGDQYVIKTGSEDDSTSTYQYRNGNLKLID
ncbi:sigma-70 family RNA polymerase sigma factor [Pontibacillus yanchengensis]|uniref:Sigma-70 family RNA polymerase sigma factor n=1 Tax=Pontibacillus yanchengensis TaxID=462910 RepID=A0A6I5A0U7_9BACI|nr:RNA polymerase sigma factor [Pontibacillus yanchengensis]MYL35016.1 sigma-70 family RNA polymerase sigma factor [Pontibacillus yanchengensis]